MKAKLLSVNIKAAFRLIFVSIVYILLKCLDKWVFEFSFKVVHKLFPYEGAQIVPMAQPIICKWYLQLQIKLPNVSIDAKNVVIRFLEVVRLEYFSKDVLTDFTPSAFGILIYNDFTSRETRYELSRTKSIWLIFLRKWLVSCWDLFK